MTYFLDTNTCIYFLKGLYPSIRAKLQSLKPREVQIPSIVKAELLFGAENSDRVTENREKVISFLFPFEIVPFDTEAAEIYAAIRLELQKKGIPIGANDLIIAATVLARGGTLITNNEREFKRVKKLKVRNWTR